MHTTTADDATAMFTREKRIWFHHCDPAGIVFYPQYLLLMNEVLQEWFESGLRTDYAGLFAERRLGIPTARLECDFHAPSRLGDRVRFALCLNRIGNSSFHLHFSGTGADPADVRVRIKAVLVCISLDSHRPVPIPGDIRDEMQRWLVPAAAAATT
ncbi:thioesterase family protein [Streptomyces sp. NPDC048191]|uniref:acyl-CoA thioesterase n=1 Tax=Streptomyces sp. NPDC048191 TaxID=3155484 RepID=UPI0034092201